MGEAGNESKRELFAHFARVGKALASPARLQLLELVAQAPRTVEALAEATSMSAANTSQHLKVMREAGLVSARKRGLFVTYSLADPAVEALLLDMQSVAASRLGQVEVARRAYFGAADETQRIELDELRAQLDHGRVTLLDVRPPVEFAAGHLPGAQSVPLGQLDERIASLPPGKDVVAYCRGPYCVYAVEAAARLRARGLSASVYDGGLSGWRHSGLPVEAQP